jgi:septum formation topological specificity factor MinE
MSKPGDYLLEALRKHAQAQIAKHRANITTYRLNPAGIGEHSDIVETIEKEMMEIAKYDDILEMLDKYFKDDNKNLLG